MYKDVYLLEPTHDGRKSFNGKAQVLIKENGDLILRSYNTDVATISWSSGIKKAEVYEIYSPTSLRHIKEFLLQNKFKADNKKQIVNDYLKSET